MFGVRVGPFHLFDGRPLRHLFGIVGGHVSKSEDPSSCKSVEMAKIAKLEQAFISSAKVANLQGDTTR